MPNLNVGCVKKAWISSTDYGINNNYFIYASVNVLPHLPPHGLMRGFGGEFDRVIIPCLCKKKIWVVLTLFSYVIALCPVILSHNLLTYKKTEKANDMFT